MPLKNGRFTPQEEAFAQHYARTGDARYAAEKAGYSPRSIGARASDNANDPAVRARVATLRSAMLAEASVEAVDVLVATMRDAKAPAQAKNTAAGIILKYATADASGAEMKEPHEMTHDELRQSLARLEARKAALESVKADRAKPVVELEVEPEADVFG